MGAYVVAQQDGRTTMRVDPDTRIIVEADSNGYLTLYYESNQGGSWFRTNGSTYLADRQVLVIGNPST